MRVTRLEVRNLRILSNVKVECSLELNFVVGQNGSGKSSFLEAIHILGSGRSFRSRCLRDVVAYGASNLHIIGSTINNEGVSDTIGIESSLSGVRIRRSGENVRAASELVAFLPMLTSTLDSYRLITDGADLRRRMINRLLFHVEPRYLDQYQRYQRALRQRNTALRQHIPKKEFGSWNTELATAGEQLTALRVRYLERVLPIMEGIVAKLVGIPINIRFHQGWDATVTLEEAYARSLTSDHSRGYTQAGPHCADLRFTVDERLARSVLSRGEIKRLVVAILIAQVRDLTEILRASPVVLLDDLASELDSDSRSQCLAELRSTGAQLFLTVIQGHGFPEKDVGDACAFHVEQGRITQVV